MTQRVFLTTISQFFIPTGVVVGYSVDERYLSSLILNIKNRIFNRKTIIVNILTCVNMTIAVKIPTEKNENKYRRT
jgi:hypothetical protein